MMTRDRSLQQSRILLAKGIVQPGLLLAPHPGCRPAEPGLHISQDIMTGMDGEAVVLLQLPASPSTTQRVRQMDRKQGEPT